MIHLPTAPESPNVQVLAQQYRERFTGLATATITLAYEPIRTVNDVGLELLTKNGAVLDPSSAYTISGKTITLSVAAIVGDVFLVFYRYRS